MIEESESKKRKSGERKGVKDRISELPDYVVHHIYSFLPTKDVVKTTVLSKLWQSNFLSYPNLDFNESLHCKHPNLYFHKQPLEKKKFFKFVNDTLLRFCKQNLNIEKLRLRLSLESADTSRVDQWIALAINRSVKEVDLETPRSHLFENFYQLTQDIVDCRSLTVLRMCNCDLKRCLSENVVVNLPSLQKLGLKQVKLNQFMLNKLLQGCPSVSDFSCDRCFGLKKLSVSGLHKLKLLEVILMTHYTESIQIDAPILESLTIVGDSVVMIDSVTGLKLKSLTLKRTDFVNDEFLEHLLLKSPVLASLGLEECCNLHRLNFSGHHLKNLTIGKCWSLRYSRIDTPNLHSFEYEGDSANPISFVSAPCWWQIQFNLYCQSFQLLDLKNFLQGKKIKNFTLSYYPVSKLQSVLDPYDIISSGTSPGCEIEHLRLRINESLPSNYETIINGLLSICHPKILSVAYNIKFIEFLCKKLTDSRDPKCCSKKEHKCWRHKLKDVKIERTENCENHEALLIQRPIEWDTLLEVVSIIAADTGQDFHIYFSLNWMT